ncbi:MAG: nucleoside deaminase [Candidatus Auribacterota bacterium]|jgi:tRNA(Arg) A34 adenosine deaminase TadA|nr:nucleoside deaminase [Candidatus Auribacterota bacterium]
MNRDINEEFMRIAIANARYNLDVMSGGPFGACIVRNGDILAVARNTVISQDATCHAEVNAIRTASRLQMNYDLSGCDIYSTTEPCPMCFGAIHWSKIGRIIYGTSIEDAKKLGFNELDISNTTMKELGNSPVEIIGGFLLDECLQLFDEWRNKKNAAVY